MFVSVCARLCPLPCCQHPRAVQHPDRALLLSRDPLNFSILSPLPGAWLQLLLLGCKPKQPGLPGAASSFPALLGFLLRGEPSRCLTKPRKLRLFLLGTCKQWLETGAQPIQTPSPQLPPTLAPSPRQPPAPRTAAEGREELREAPAAGRISRAAIKLLVTPQLCQPDKDTRYPLTYIKRGS